MRAAQLVKYLTLLQEFDWQYLTACPSAFTVYHKPFLPDMFKERLSNVKRSDGRIQRIKVVEILDYR